MLRVDHFHSLMAISVHARGNSKLVGYHGVTGAHSHDAVEELLRSQPSFRNRSFDTKGFPSIDDLFDALRNHSVEFAIVPIENAHSGTLHPNLTPIVESARVEGGIQIAGEYVHEECNSLLVTDANMRIGDITEIRSHPAILDQTRVWIREAKRRGELRQDVRLIAGQNSAECAKQLTTIGTNHIAAIASPSAGKAYNLHSLVENVSPSANFTRYYLLSSAGTEPSNAQRHLNPKTTLVLTLSNRPGVLFKILGCFSLRDINVLRMAFHPTPRAIGLSSPWEYSVWIDVEGAASSDPRLRNALQNVEEFVQECVTLGTYPRYLAPMGSAVNSGTFSM